jgi:hypothetical protein
MLELNPDLAGASFERACEMADALHRLCESPAPHEQADWRETMHGLTLRAVQAERQRDSLVAVLARLFDWEDKTYVHAVMRVENAVGNLRADLAAAKSESME